MHIVVGSPGQATKIHLQAREAEGTGRSGSGPKGSEPNFPIFNQRETKLKSLRLLEPQFLHLEIRILTLHGCREN